MLKSQLALRTAFQELIDLTKKGFSRPAIYPISNLLLIFPIHFQKRGRPFRRLIGYSQSSVWMLSDLHIWLLLPLLLDPRFQCSHRAHDIPAMKKTPERNAPAAVTCEVRDQAWKNGPITVLNFSDTLKTIKFG